MLKTTGYLRRPILFTTRSEGGVAVHLHIGTLPFLPSHLKDLKACFQSRIGRAPEYAVQHSGVPWTTISLFDYLDEREELDLIEAIVVMLNRESEVEWDRDLVFRKATEWFSDPLQRLPGS
jgi:hypothetical protein